MTRLSLRPKPPRTPVVLQAEITECGLAALAMLLGYYGTHVTLEEMRQAVGGTRLGVSLLTLKDVAKRYGFDARVFRMETEELATMGLPVIAYCRFVHFVVVEHIADKEVIINDPSVGPDRIAIEEFSDDFTGLALSISPRAPANVRGRVFSSTRWLWDRVEATDLRWVGSAALTVAAAAGALTFASLAGHYIDRVAGGAADVAGVTALLAAAGLALSAGWVRDQVAIAALGRVVREMSFRSLDRLSRLPSQFFKNRHPSQIIEKLGAPSELVRQGHALAAALDVVGVVAACALALWIRPWIGVLICTSVALEIATVITAWGRRGITTAGAATSPLARIGFPPATLGQMEPHFVSGGESELFSRVSGLHAKACDSAIRAAVGRIRLDGVRRFIGLARPGLTFIAGLLAMERGQLSVGQFGELVILAFFVGVSLEPLEQLSGLRELRLCVHQLADLETAGPMLREEVSRTTRQGARLSLNSLGWRPSPRLPFLFSGLSLNIAAGAQIGVTGRSLSGKSVLAQLLCGFLEPSQGTIVFDGTPNSTPAQAGAVLVAAHGPIIPGTVRDNLLLGTLFDDRHLTAALVDVGLDAEIQSRGGLNLRLEHAGRELSGGQQRRLEIARTLVRSPGLLVIDEALDGVDIQLERAIRISIRRRGITLVAVTGRSESLAQCDVVVNLDDYVPRAPTNEA